MADDFRIIEGANDPWYQYRNILGVPSRRRIICGFVSIIFILTLVVIAFAVMGNPKYKNAQQPLRSQTEKLEPFADFQNALNTSADPCVDFYDFSCGLWSQRIPENNYKSRVTAFNLLQDAIDEKKMQILENTLENPDLPYMSNYAINFFNMCVEESLSNNSSVGTKALGDYLNQIGGWPILNKSEWDESLFDWLNVTAILSKNFAINFVFDISVVHNKIQSKNYFFVKLPKMSPILLNFNIDMLHVILMKLNGSHEGFDLDLMVNTVEKWKSLIYDSEIKYDSITITVGDLIEQVPNIDWLRYLQIIWHDNLLEINETISLNDTVMIESMDFLKTVERVLNSDAFSKSDLANLFSFIFVQHIWILIPGVLPEYSAMNGYDAREERSAAKLNCYNLVSDLFSRSLDYLYIKNSSAEVEDTKSLTRYIKSAFHDILQDSSLLDEESKETVLHKLDEMVEIVGFPPYLNNKTAFDILFNDFPPTSKNIVEYYFQIREYYTHLKDGILPRSVTDASAYYIVQNNTFVFPISLHNPPFYYRSGPSYLNFGAIGSVIGHEMMHGFDAFESSKKYGLVNPFTNATTVLFKKRTDCFTDQYDQYDSSKVCKNNGTLTLRENVADSEGLHIAFKAYKKYERDFGHMYRYQQFSNYTSDQMFFISYGTMWCSKIKPGAYTCKDRHSFPELRVNGAVSNLKSFALAFNCPENSPMNPAERCFIW